MPLSMPSIHKMTQTVMASGAQTINPVRKCFFTESTSAGFYCVALLAGVLAGVVGTALDVLSVAVVAVAAPSAGLVASAVWLLPRKSVTYQPEPLS